MPGPATGGPAAIRALVLIGPAAAGKASPAEALLLRGSASASTGTDTRVSMAGVFERLERFSPLPDRRRQRSTTLKSDKVLGLIALGAKGFL